MRGIRRRPDDESRVTTAELFFDLVFVFVVTQLSNLLAADMTLRGVARSTVLLLAAWWAWIYTTWTTNWFDADTIVVRALLLVVGFAGMLGAISIPHAFDSRAWLFVAGYVAIQALRNLFVVLVTHRDDPLYRPVQRILGWTLAVPLVRTVRTHHDGPTLNAALGRTGMLQLAFCALLSAGILAS